MIKVVVFDFDGVIVDSEYECYMAAIDAFRQLGGKVEKNEKSWQVFRKLRKFVLVAEDYWPVLKILEDANAIDVDKLTRSDFERIKETMPDPSRRLEAEFYRVRKGMIDNDFDRWAGMHTLYPEIKDAINSMEGSCNVMVVTAKDSYSTGKLLGHFGIRISESGIIGREQNGSKAEKLGEIAEKMGMKVSEILFIEDMVENAVMAKEIGVKVAVVEWGYAGKERLLEAEKMGIMIIRKGNVKRQIEGLITGL